MESKIKCGKAKNMGGGVNTSLFKTNNIMNKKQKTNLIIMILQDTTEWSCDQLDYRITDEAVVIWSKNGFGGCFFQTDIIPRFKTSHISYNSDEHRVELIVKI